MDFLGAELDLKYLYALVLCYPVSNIHCCSIECFITVLSVYEWIFMRLTYQPVACICRTLVVHRLSCLL